MQRVLLMIFFKTNGCTVVGPHLLCQDCCQQRMWKGYRKKLRLLGRNMGYKCSTKTGSFTIKDGQEILVDPNHFVYLPKYPLLI